MKHETTEDRAAQAAVAESIKCHRAGVKDKYKCAAISADGNESEEEEELVCLNGDLNAFLPGAAAKSKAAPSSGSTKAETPTSETVEQRAEAEKPKSETDEPPNWDAPSEPEAAVADEDPPLFRVCAKTFERPAAVAEAAQSKAMPRRCRSSTPSCKPGLVLRSNSPRGGGAGAGKASRPFQPTPSRSRTPPRTRESQAERNFRLRSRCSRQDEAFRGRGDRVYTRPTAVAAPGDAVRSQVMTAIDKPTVGKRTAVAEATPPEVKPQDLPGWIGVGNGMVSTWIVGYRANSDELVKQLHDSVFDVIIVQSVPVGFNCFVHSALVVAAECSKMWDRASADPTDGQSSQKDTASPATKLGWEKSVHEMMSNTFAVIHRKKVKTVGTIEYALAPAAEKDTAVADLVTSRSRWGLAQLGTITLSLQTTKQRYTSIKLGVVYRQGDWEDQPRS